MFGFVDKHKDLIHFVPFPHGFELLRKLDDVRRFSGSHRSSGKVETCSDDVIDEKLLEIAAHPACGRSVVEEWMFHHERELLKEKLDKVLDQSKGRLLISFLFLWILIFFSFVSLPIPSSHLCGDDLKALTRLEITLFVWIKGNGTDESVFSHRFEELGDELSLSAETASDESRVVNRKLFEFESLFCDCQLDAAERVAEEEIGDNAFVETVGDLDGKTVLCSLAEDGS